MPFFHLHKPRKFRLHHLQDESSGVESGRIRFHRFDSREHRLSAPFFGISIILLAALLLILYFLGGLSPSLHPPRITVEDALK
jgi:hypothetical protein